MYPQNNFSHAQMSKYLAEFLGTGALVLTIKVGVANLTDVESDLGSFAIGFVLMVIIYQYGYISGAHFNPAVTLGIVVSGGTESFPSNNWEQILMYWTAQFLGGFLGGLYSWTIGGKHACLVYPELDRTLFLSYTRIFLRDNIYIFIGVKRITYWHFSKRKLFLWLNNRHDTICCRFGNRFSNWMRY